MWKIPKPGDKVRINEAFLNAWNNSGSPFYDPLADWFIWAASNIRTTLEVDSCTPSRYDSDLCFVKISDREWGVYKETGAFHALLNGPPVFLTEGAGCPICGSDGELMCSQFWCSNELCQNYDPRVVPEEEEIPF